MVKASEIISSMLMRKAAIMLTPNATDDELRELGNAIDKANGKPIVFQSGMDIVEFWNHTRKLRDKRDWPEYSCITTLSGTLTCCSEEWYRDDIGIPVYQMDEVVNTPTCVSESDFNEVFG